MAGSLSLHSSSHFIEREAKVTEKQGIVTILGSDCETGKTASLRRTLSADMSSKKWLAQQGFSPMKKIASSAALSIPTADSHSSSSSSDEDDDTFRNRSFQMWSSMDQGHQNQKMKKDVTVGQFDIWSSMMAKKHQGEENKSVIQEAPYVHPLVRKQSNSLKGKSLEVCTESLGSETGSEGFSSKTDNMEVDLLKNEEQEAELQKSHEEKIVSPKASEHVEEFQVVKYNPAAAAVAPAKKSVGMVPRKFPPPIPSLLGSYGESLRIKTHRDNGRVVLEAVSVPCPNNFRAQRQDGRLVLTLVTPTCQDSDEVRQENKVEEFDEEKLVNFAESETEDEEEDDVEEEEEVEVERQVVKQNEMKETEIEMEEAPKMLTSRVTNVHRLALMMKRPIALANRTHGWAADKLNQVVKYGSGDDEEKDEVEVVLKPTPQLAQSLPPRPNRVARLIPKSPAAATATAAGSLNAYEYYWRAKPAAGLNYPLTQAGSPPNMKSEIQMENQQKEQFLVLRGSKGDHHIVPLTKTCSKETRRSLLFWEPYCIATT